MNERYIDAVVLLAVLLFMLNYFNINLLMLDTTMSGGDISSINYFTRYLRDNLVPKGRLIGWSPGWYAGFPCFQFYFPMVFHIIVLASYFLKFNIAFKTVTALTVISLPYAAYISLRQMGYKTPTPTIGAVLTLPFIFTERYEILGGNISSMLAGLIAYSLGLIALVVYAGTFPTGLKGKKHYLSNSVLLAAAILSSSFTSLFAVILTLAYTPSRRIGKFMSNLAYAARVSLQAFLLTAWWSLPLVFKHKWAAMSSLARHDTFDFILKNIPTEFTPIYLVGLVGVYVSFRNRDERMKYLLVPFVLAFLLFAFLPHTPLISTYTYNGRYISMMYLFSLAASAYGFSEVSARLRVRNMAPMLLFLVVTYAINANLSFTQSWINGSYAGFESKTGWRSYKEAMDFLSHLPVNARVMYEHSQKHAYLFGSSRAFESTPYFSNKPGLEGTVFESSLSSVFVVSVLQAELSDKPSCPLRGVKCPPMDMDDAAAHSKIFNVKYVILTSRKAQDTAGENSNFKLLDSIPAYGIGTINVYELLNHDGHYVVVPENYPVIVETSRWHDVSLRWFRNTNFTDVPLVLNGDDSLEEHEDYAKVGEDFSTLPKRPINMDCEINETVGEDYVEFDTNCVGLPHIVKNSYFPNWRADGALGPYLVSPSLMMVVPLRGHVSLRYGSLLVDDAGAVLTAIGLFVAAYSLLTINGYFRAKVHGRIAACVGWVFESRLVSAVTRECRSRCVDCSNAVSGRMRKLRQRAAKKLLAVDGQTCLAVLVSVAIVSGGAFYALQQHECSIVCKAGGWSYSNWEPFKEEVVDFYDLGFKNDLENKRHELSCLYGCDEIRPDHIYTGWSTVRFKMKVKPGEDNMLVFTMDNNYDCRSMTVYVNNVNVGGVIDYGREQGFYNNWREYEVRVPAKILREDTAVIRIENERDECSGWDISEVKSVAAGCGCR